MTESSSNSCWNIKTYFFLLLASLAIGLPCMILGCDKTGSVPCQQYKAYRGTVYEHTVDKKTCQRRCKRCSAYDCWDVYEVAREKFDNTTGNSQNTCRRLMASDLTSKPNATSYPTGKEVNWLKLKNTNRCDTVGNLYMMWLTGVTSLSIFVVLSIYGCFFGSYIPQAPPSLDSNQGHRVYRKIIPTDSTDGNQPIPIDRPIDHQPQGHRDYRKKPKEASLNKIVVETAEEDKVKVNHAVSV